MGKGPPGGVLLLAVPQARTSLCFTHHWSQSSEPHIGQSHLTSSHPAARRQLCLPCLLGMAQKSQTRFQPL